jgi:hypothetical protein
MVCDGGGGAEIADGLYSASLLHTAQMSPIGKGGGLPRLLSISVLWLTHTLGTIIVHR